MKCHWPLVLALTCALWTPVQAQPETDLALQLVAELAKANGQALACQELKIAGRAKSLMMAHAPKTLRFGNAFDEATQQGFLTQINASTVCPSATVLSARLDVLAQQLQVNLPAMAPATTLNSPKETQ